MSAMAARRSFVQRSDDISSTSSSTTNSIAASPEDTPRQSPSSTSLSSLDSGSELELKDVNGKLLDTYGNEFQLPDFTIKQIRDAIPAHCFQRSGAKGLAYVARDLASLAATFYLFHTYVTPADIPSTPARAALWTIYSFVQGLFGTGLWVLAHECGHQSFSPSKTLNDTVGWFCHSALLVPYFSWKISHGKHHKATGHLERDMVFVPKTRDEYASKLGYYAYELSELMEETPILTAATMIGQQLVGWLLYLTGNVTGHNYHERQSEGRGKGKQNGVGGGVNHFDPSSPLYEAKDSKLILLSDLGLAVMATVLVRLGRSFGWANLAIWYFVPYLWVNHWLGKSSLLNTTSNHSLISAQWPSLFSSIPILRSPTMNHTRGTSPAELQRPSIANLVLSVVTCFTASSKPTSSTILFPRFLSTTLTKRPKPSSPSWVNTIDPMSMEDQLAF